MSEDRDVLANTVAGSSGIVVGASFLFIARSLYAYWRDLSEYE